MHVLSPCLKSVLIMPAIDLFMAGLYRVMLASLRVALGADDPYMHVPHREPAGFALPSTPVQVIVEQTIVAGVPEMSGLDAASRAQLASHPGLDLILRESLLHDIDELDIDMD